MFHRAHYLVLLISLTVCVSQFKFSFFVLNSIVILVSYYLLTFDPKIYSKRYKQIIYYKRYKKEIYYKRYKEEIYSKRYK